MSVEGGGRLKFFGKGQIQIVSGGVEIFLKRVKFSSSNLDVAVVVGGGGGVVEFFLTLTFFGGLNFFFRGLHINKTYIPRGMSFLSALSIFFGQGGGGRVKLVSRWASGSVALGKIS